MTEVQDFIQFTTPGLRVVEHTLQGGKNKGQVVMRFQWDKDFAKTRANRFSIAQKFLDSEVLRTTSPYVPRRTGTLERSGQLGTVIGSGKVVYNTPYAPAQYYNTAQTRDYDPRRGGMWFERSKADHKEEWLNGAAKILGGKAEKNG